MNNGDVRFESHRERHDPLTTEEDLLVQQSACQHLRDNLQSPDPT
jgi:hypothetical protein